MLVELSDQLLLRVVLARNAVHGVQVLGEQPTARAGNRRVVAVGGRAGGVDEGVGDAAYGRDDDDDLVSVGDFAPG